MIKLWKTEEEKLQEQKKIQEQEELQKQKELEQIKEQERKEKERLEKLQQLDVEARQKLQGEFKERYVLAKEMGLERQAEIARIEGLTNTQFIDLVEYAWILDKKIACKLGYSIGGEHYCAPNLEIAHSSIQNFPGKIPLGAMIRYQEVKDFFDCVRIMHFEIGDPVMYGVKNWEGEELYFLIMMWE